jgi:hypothetical protein
MGMHEESLQDANQCVSLDKNWPKGYYRLGVALVNLNQHTEALMAFELGLAFLSSTSESDEKLALEFNKRILALQEIQINAQSVAKQEEVRRATVTAATLAVSLNRNHESEDIEGGVANVYVSTLSEGIVW